MKYILIYLFIGIILTIVMDLFCRSEMEDNEPISLKDGIRSTLIMPIALVLYIFELICNKFKTEK